MMPPDAYSFKLRKRFLNSLLILALAATAAGCYGGRVVRYSAAQKAEIERMLKTVRPFPQQMLANHKELPPYGATIDATGKITKIGGEMGDMPPMSADEVALLGLPVRKPEKFYRIDPKSAEALARLRQVCRREALSGEIVASALVYHVRADVPGLHATEAIIVDVDNREGITDRIVHAYNVGGDKKLYFSNRWGWGGKGEIFGTGKTKQRLLSQPNDRILRPEPSSERP